MAPRDGLQGPRLDETEKIEIRGAVPAVCYPDPESSHCRRLLSELEKAGVTHYVNYGKVELPGGYRLLGRGWAGNVFLALWRDSVVAVKALHPRSRRSSMLWEAAAWAVAAWAGVAPRLHMSHRLFILVDPVHGPQLADMEPAACIEAKHLLRRLLWKAYRLDRLGIRHGELARPGGQVLVDPVRQEPYIVDYDSSTVHQNPGNLTQLVGGLARLEWARRCTKIGAADAKLRATLRAYKHGPSLRVFDAILSHLDLGLPA
ncbi:MAG TPA: hypothetical protein EYH50_04305 [Pyrodictium delaneyi]|uniref:Serine/threonine protein kinase n=1 Tax=Pyrodictium delaneyi TaxID=1273541 RepID=A0A833E960_9CREN|nr:hypothetical protein [Pyrodictium delaneyi]